MTTSPIAATASAARQRLASSLAALQQDPNIPAPILEIVSGLARAMGPLFQVERGTGDPSLLYTARAVLQDTLSRMQSVDQSHPGVEDATRAIAQSLGMIFATIKEHRIAEPGPAQPPQPLPRAQAPVPLVQPVAAPMPLVQPAAAPIPLVQYTSPPVSSVATALPNRPVETAYREPARSIIPDTAAKVPVGASGLPRLECELDVHSDSTFYTNFLGDIRDHGGIFVATFGTLSVNTPCEVVISFPGALTAEVRGIVRWKRDANGETGQIPGLGVEITQGAPDAWKLIDRFIKNRDPIIHEV